MSKRSTFTLALAAVLAAAGLSTDARAGRDGGDPWLDRGGRAVMVLARGIDADAAAGRARRATGGRVLGVRRSGDVFLVRLLLDGGKVRTVRVDASTGRVLR